MNEERGPVGPNKGRGVGLPETQRRTRRPVLGGQETWPDGKGRRRSGGV